MTEAEKTEIPVPHTIPEQFREKYAAIAALIIPFCDEKLNDDYKALCLHALEKLCRKRNQPLASGKINMWAAGIVYAIAQNSYLLGNQYNLLMGRPKYHLTSDEVAGAFGVSKGGMDGKARWIRNELNINKENEEWMLPEWRDSETRKAFQAFSAYMTKIEQRYEAMRSGR